MKKIVIIVPCYNEEEVLHILYTEALKYLDSNYNFNLVFIDDGSSDRTLEIAMELSRSDERVKYLSFSRNFGKEAAMYAGLEAAVKLNADAVIQIDADLQDPPSLIPEMISSYEQGYKHIYAKHKTRKGEPALKTFFAKLFYRIYAFLTGDKNLSQGARDFCLMDRTVVDAFLAIKDHKRFTKGIFSWVGFKKKCIEFDYVPRVAGKTKWSFTKLLKYALMGIKQFSHIYVVIPTLAFIVVSIITIVDIIYGLANVFIWQTIKIDLFVLLVLISLRYLMVLLYDVRDHNLNRPIYIADETNIGEQSETDF